MQSTKMAVLFFQLYVNGEHVSTNLSLNDGWWHHVAVSWEMGGEWNIYLNGTRTRYGTNLSPKSFIQDDGYLIIGQY